ncbi:MAG: DUF1844 domain-containing protein [Planctomycetota bacterium]|jgi:hypothetical protein
MPEEPQSPKLHIESDFRSKVEAEREPTAPAPGSKPDLQIDSDWKAQAQAEKERLSAKEAEKTAGGGEAGGRELPAADFKTLVGVLATQAIMGLGAMGDPQTGRRVIDLEGARFSIDLLGVLEEKTAGNLSDEEAAELKQVLAELRARFVQITQLVAQHAVEGAGGPDAATPPSG